MDEGRCAERALPETLQSSTDRVRVDQATGAKSVSRLALSPDGKWLAFVAEPAP